MKPLIGIVAKSYRDDDWSSPFSGQRSGYSEAVALAGGLPIIIPLTDDKQLLKHTYERLDGLLLAGGGDIDPARFGEERHRRHDAIDRIMAIDSQRDSCELTLARWAARDAKPVLGICRGMQILNIAHGGDLYQDIERQTSGAVDHIASLEHKDWQYLAHSVCFAADTQLGSLLGAEPLEVNSLHHQAVRRLGKGLTVAGWSEDGIIEALEGLACWGVQFHPEELISINQNWLKLFDVLVSRAGSYKGSATVLSNDLSFIS